MSQRRRSNDQNKILESLPFHLNNVVVGYCDFRGAKIGVGIPDLLIHLEWLHGGDMNNQFEYGRGYWHLQPATLFVLGRFCRASLPPAFRKLQGKHSAVGCWISSGYYANRSMVYRNITYSVGRVTFTGDTSCEGKRLGGVTDLCHGNIGHCQEQRDSDGYL